MTSEFSKTNLFTGKILVILLCCALFIGHFIYFFLFVEEVDSLKYGTNLEGKSDVIVVLTGGSGRISAGLELLRNKRANHLFVSGVNKDSDKTSIFNDSLTEKEKKAISIEKSSLSTYGNALETKGFLKAIKGKKIILLTSDYHMKRALFTFKKVLPENIEINTYVVKSENVDASNIFDFTTLRVLTSECIKYYWYKIFYI